MMRVSEGPTYLRTDTVTHKNSLAFEEEKNVSVFFLVYLNAYHSMYKQHPDPT